MRFVIVALLLGVWLYLANSAFHRGNTGLACLYVAIGVALTLYRLRK